MYVGVTDTAKVYNILNFSNKKNPDGPHINREI